ncbi:MAG: hypothetical protein ACI9OI_001621, partial [Chitinophagales bacterium]
LSVAFINKLCPNSANFYQPVNNQVTNEEPIQC